MVNPPVKRLIPPLGGLLAAALAGAALTAPAQAAPVELKSDWLPANGADAKAIAAHWTPAYLKSAKPYLDDAAYSAKLSAKANRAAPDGKPGMIAPTGASSSRATAGKSKNVNLPATAGKVFFEVNGKPYWCSGSAVHSRYRNLVATAAHCVYDTKANAYLKNWIFIPGYYQGKAPWGIFVGAKAHVPYDFAVYEDYDHDYAFVNVYNGIKQTGEKTVAKAEYDAYTGPKYTQDVAITEAEYKKCKLAGGGESPDCWAKVTEITDEVGPNHPDAVQVKKEVTKEEYDKAPRGRRAGAKWEEISGRNGTEQVTKAEYDAYKGPGTKVVDKRGNYTIVHYYLKYFVKKSAKVDYYKTVFRVLTYADAGRLGDLVGGQGFAWNQKLGKKGFVFGHPIGAHLVGPKVFTGHTLKWCYGATAKAPVVAKYRAEAQQAVKCGFTPGASGGPFLLQYSNTKRVGYLNGVVSLTLDTNADDRFDTVTLPYFDGDTARVYQTAANLWTGKLPL